MNILIIEDNNVIANNIYEALEINKYNCTKAVSYENALSLLDTYSYDLIILDINLWGHSGLDVLDVIRSYSLNKDTYVLILTVHSNIDFKLSSFEKGTDDYLTKPFLMAELLARVKVLLRRKAFNRNDRININKNLYIDVSKKKVLLDSIELKLTPIEYKLLLHLVNNNSIVLSSNSIIESVWGYSSDLVYKETLKVNISRLRKKIGKDVIKTVKGSGYIIDF